MIEEVKKTTLEHYQYVANISELDIITRENVNIAIYDRAINDELQSYIHQLTQTGFEPIRTMLIIKDFDNIFDTHFEAHPNISTIGYQLLKNDIKELLAHFSEICNASQFKIFFGIVDTDMCRRFHSDMNELRMLCSYEGQGTLWLTEDNINEKALYDGKGNEEIVLRQNDIKQLSTGDVAILKGALYPECNTGGIVHRSPTIENVGQKRIILRVDSNYLFSSFS